MSEPNSPYSDYASLPPDSRPQSDLDENRIDDDAVQIEETVQGVDWVALASIACDHFKTQSGTWGTQLVGGYNIIRFLQLDDEPKTEVVVRVPLRPEGGFTDEAVSLRLSNRVASEVASMEYVAKHTSIPVPVVIAHSTDINGDGIGSPYVIMSKVDGVPLSSVWEGLEDEKRDVILQEVVDILVQLSTLRFDGIGVLMKGDGTTNPDWYLVPPTSFLSSPLDPRLTSHFPQRVFKSSLDYWAAYVTANLHSIDERFFGRADKTYEYAIAWFLRSLIPAICDPTLDEGGFPLCHGDLHSQNIMVTDLDTPSPRISGIIDWEFTSTESTSAFAQYPLFIVDHPLWDELDHPLRVRNVRDQAVFRHFMETAERQRGIREGLANAFGNCRGFYLFQQCLQCEFDFGDLRNQLFEHYFGKEELDHEDFSIEYYQALIKGVLSRKADQFEEETEILKEAQDILGEEIFGHSVSRPEFQRLVVEQKDRFSEDSIIHDWLTRTASGSV